MLRLFAMLGLVALFFFSAFTPPQSVLSAEIIPLPVKILGAFFEESSARIPSEKTKAFYRQSDSSLTDSLDAIAWAVKRSNLRACSDLPTHQHTADLLLLCVATVQDDEDRCNRIENQTLQKLCHEVVAV